ncbi:non-canonical purine NTP diphosphatase [Xylanibacter oryzae]|uniref:non-canonical purine NTP diphosphatase n=1 Tax=Xylanibacter oryzae TaxID=185293 RepID=UPI0004B05AEF|nr:non-canonical purine NTP diphosphatase [Xylanibacter oryzae]
MKIVFATNNNNKLREIREILGNKYEIVSLKDIGCDVDIPETSDTLEGNALIKAKYVYDNYHMNVFADDTGLEVEALNGAPGVYSARYAGGDGHDSDANMAKLLMKLGENNNRNARFRTVIALILNKEGSEKPEIHEFEGIVEGSILKEKSGNTGFGYDPLFVPKGYNESFAQLGEEIKNKISHRAIAVGKLSEFLK